MNMLFSITLKGMSVILHNCKLIKKGYEEIKIYKIEIKKKNNRIKTLFLNLNSRWN